MGKRMDIKEIVQLMERFDASKATKLQLKQGDTELVLESTAVQTVCVQQIEPEITGRLSSDHMPGGGQQAASIGSSVATATAERNAVAKPGAAQTEVSGIPVKAPLVGTFYCAPSPEDKPFVSVGQRVKKGDVVGIIEAMKLMNEITAPEDGVVKTIFAENGNMVEYGEVLMVLE